MSNLKRPRGMSVGPRGLCPVSAIFHALRQENEREKEDRERQRQAANIILARVTRYALRFVRREAKTAREALRGFIIDA